MPFENIDQFISKPVSLSSPAAESILARLSLPREWPLSLCQNGVAIRTATAVGHLLEEVRILTEQMSQPNQSNGRTKVSRVFGRSQDGQGNPSSSINQNLPHYNISVSSQCDCNNKC